MAQYATSFSDFVDWTATNSPHGTILDWWRRVDGAIRHYFAEELCIPLPKRRTDRERHIWQDPALGPETAELVRWLRVVRNVVVHQEPAPVSRDQAVTYAQHANRLIWALGFRQPVSEFSILPVSRS